MNPMMRRRVTWFFLLVDSSFFGGLVVFWFRHCHSLPSLFVFLLIMQRLRVIEIQLLNLLLFILTASVLLEIKLIVIDFPQSSDCFSST
jgi:hypothetical protein